MDDSIPVACRLEVLTSTERALRAALFSDFRASIQKLRELDDGYEVSLDPRAMPRQKIEALVRLESRDAARS